MGFALSYSYVCEFIYHGSSTSTLPLGTTDYRSMRTAGRLPQIKAKGRCRPCPCPSRGVIFQTPISTDTGTHYPRSMLPMTRIQFLPAWPEDPTCQEALLGDRRWHVGPHGMAVWEIQPWRPGGRAGAAPVPATLQCASSAFPKKIRIFQILRHIKFLDT
jgi:hypothetical protein